MLGWISPVGILASALYYQPTLVSGDADELFHAFVPSIFWLAPVPVTDRLTVTCLASLDFMDRRYAAAWFSVEEPTAELAAFRARAGLRDVQLIVRAEYRLTERLAATLLAGNLYLLADAADSPYTRTPYRLKAGGYLSYAFRR
jgi:outer membrane scaffolding protein for murein synthesis (MipA/OmpV family)